MKSAVTVGATSPPQRLQCRHEGTDGEDAPAAARLIMAPFAAIRFLISITTGRFEDAGSSVAKSTIPKALEPAALPPDVLDIFTMIAAVVLGSSSLLKNPLATAGTW